MPVGSLISAERGLFFRIIILTFKGTLWLLSMGSPWRAATIPGPTLQRRVTDQFPVIFPVILPTQFPFEFFRREGRPLPIPMLRDTLLERGFVILVYREEVPIPIVVYRVIGMLGESLGEVGVESLAAGLFGAEVDRR